MAGARFLFHVAADYRLWARNPLEILWNNREGTRLLMQTALAAEVERIVYTSSAATIACAADGGQADETMRLNQSCAVGAYKQSKVAAEQIVETMIARDLFARHYRPSDGADRTARPEADADRADHCRGGIWPYSGFRRHRAQSRACR
jgi:nucleoside-diphosphate-sugar epimerase